MANLLIQSTADMEVKEIVMRAFESATEYLETGKLISIEMLKNYLYEEMTMVLCSDFEDFYEDYFGIQIEVSDVYDIPPDLLAASGLKIPNLSIAEVISIFESERICFEMEGRIYNSPQINP